MELWLVIDLEATTDEGGWPVEEMEIIEIGMSLVDDGGCEHDHFQRFVRPRERPVLTDFCQALTHITQGEVDQADPLPVVWRHLEQWLQPHLPALQAWVSWGDYDRRQLVQDWRSQRIPCSLAEVPHVNLKQRFAKAQGLDRPVGLNSALQRMGFTFEGLQHRALADARNTARLLPASLKR